MPKKPTDASSRGGLILPYGETLVHSAFPDSGIAVPFGRTIVQSATPWLWTHPDRVPELATLVASPGFSESEAITLHAWPIVMGAHMPGPALLTLQRMVSSNTRAIGRVRQGLGFSPKDFAHEVRIAIWAILQDPIRGFAARWTLREALEKARGGYLACLPEYVRQRLEARRREDLEIVKHRGGSVELVWGDAPVSAGDDTSWFDFYCDERAGQTIEAVHTARLLELVKDEGEFFERYVALKLQGATDVEAAKALKCSVTTLWRLRKNLEIKVSRRR